MTKYWENLELNFDPFDPNEEVSPCFLSEHALYLLDLITQLSCHSHASLMVLAPSGGGKSTLAKAFVNKLGASGICQIRGDQSITIDFLRFLLAKHLGIQYTENQPEQFNKQLAHQLEAMAKHRQKFYIVVDDAHALPERTLAGLLTLASRQPHEFPPLHMIFFGSLPLETTVSDVVLQQNLDIVTHTSRIKAFDLNTTRNYISHCLKVAGFIGDCPLTDNEVEQIFADTDGLPGLINQEVVSYLGQKRMRSRNSQKAKAASTKYPLNIGAKKIIGMVGLFALIAVAFMVVNHPVQLPTVTTADSSQSIVTDSKLAHQSNYLQPKQTTRLTSNDVDTLTITEPQIESTTLPIQSPANIAAVPDVATELAVEDEILAPPTKIAPTPIKQKVQVAAAKPIVQKPKVKPAVTPLAASKYSVHEKNLLGRDATHYTLQLMGAYDSAPLRKFAAKTHLTQDAWYFHTWHNHKRWFVVVYGDYATRQDAEFAVKQLPEAVQQQKPWVRSLASVKSAITKTEKVG